MQVQTILHAASTLLGLGDGAVRQGPGDRKLLITSKMTSKGKKTPQDESVLTKKMFHCWPHYTAGWRGNAAALQINTGHVSNLQRRWVDITTNNQRTSYGDSVTRQTSSISLSHYCQGMRGLYKVTLTKCLGVSWENDITLISCLFFNWLSTTEPWIAKKNDETHIVLWLQDTSSRDLEAMKTTATNRWHDQQPTSSSLRGSFNSSVWMLVRHFPLHVWVLTAGMHMKEEAESEGDSVGEREDGMTVLTTWKNGRETKLKEASRAHPIPPLWSCVAAAL